MKKKHKNFCSKFMSIIVTMFLIIVNTYSVNATESADLDEKAITADEYEQMKIDNVKKCLCGEEHDHALCEKDQTDSKIGVTIKEYSSRTVAPWCSKCGNSYALKCNQDAQEYARTTHKSGTCTIVYMRSRAKWICGGCKDYKWDYATGTTLQYHDCWMIHQSCSLGQQHVCTISAL